MRNINLYSYQDKPFTINRNKGIYPLNDPGMERYISYESHNINYLKETNPKVFRQIINKDDEDIPESMKKAIENIGISKFEKEFVKDSLEVEPQLFNKEEGQKENSKEATQDLDNAKKAKEELLKRLKPKAKEFLLGKGKRRLPPIKVNRSVALPKSYSKQHRGNNHLVETEKTNTQTSVPKKKLPEIMNNPKLKFKPIISNINLLSSKEFGSEYNPYGSFTQTGDYIGTNIYGAKFSH